MDVPKCKKCPWEKGNDGWENYGDFQTWLIGELGEEHTEWVEDAPTKLMTVFCRVIATQLTDD